jgi:competence protein ComEC
VFAAGWIILIWNPQQLFEPGFQLSFLVVLCIILLLPPIRKLFEPRPSLQLVPPPPKPIWRLWLKAGRRPVVDAFSVSLAAWLGSIPLAACYFHVLTPISVPANFLVVPITALALMSGMASLLAAPCLPSLAVLFNHSSWFWMKCIIALSQWFSHWPAAHWNVAAPRPLAFVAYYLALLALCTGWLFQSRHKAALAGAIGLASALWLWDWRGQRQITRMDVLSPRGAPAIYLDCSSDGRNLLLDCGDANSVEAIVKPFLQARGVNRLDDFCLTVGRQANMGGASVVLTNFSVLRLEVPQARARSSVYRRLVDQWQAAARRFDAVSAGQQIGRWMVLHPAMLDPFQQADDNALVLRGELGGQSVLLLSSLGRSGQDALVQRHPELRAEIVVAGVPARDEPLSEPLLDLVQPKFILVADSQYPATRRASAKLRERLARRGVPVLYCHDIGAVTFEMGNGRWKVEDAEGNEPCNFNDLASQPRLEPENGEADPQDQQEPEAR